MTLRVPLEQVRRAAGKLKPRTDADATEVSAGIRALAWRAIEEMMHVLDSGTASEKVKVAQRLLSPMVRHAIAQGGEDEELRKLREEFSLLRSDVRSELVEDESVLAAGPPPDDPHQDRR